MTKPRTQEERALLFDLHSALEKVAAHAPDDDLCRALDNACRTWLHFSEKERIDCFEATSIDELELSVRVDAALRRFGILTVKQLRNVTDNDFAEMGIGAKIHRKNVREALAEWDAKPKYRGRSIG